MVTTAATHVHAEATTPATLRRRGAAVATAARRGRGAAAPSAVRKFLQSTALLAASVHGLGVGIGGGGVRAVGVRPVGHPLFQPRTPAIRSMRLHVQSSEHAKEEEKRCEAS